MLARGVVKLTDDAPMMRTVQCEFLPGDVREGLEHMEPYGWTSRVHPDAEAVAGFFNGDRSHGVVLVTPDRRYRLHVEEGEVAIFDDLGQKVHLKRDGIEAFTPGWLKAHVTKTADVIVDEDTTVTIGKKYTSTITGDVTKTAKANVQITVNGNAVVNVDGTLQATVKQDATIKVDGNTSATVGGSLSAKVSGSITAEGSSATVKASSVTLDASSTTCTGSLMVSGMITGKGGMAISGGGGATVSGSFDLDGSMSATGNVTAGGISLTGHTHTGVHGETSGPH